MKRLFLFFSIVISFSSKAQLRELRFDHLSVENGLPENYASCSLQDHLGYIWIGTQNGLVRYDGYDVKVYKLETERKKERNLCVIRNLFEDEEGNIWIGTFMQGLFRYNRLTDKFTEFPHGSAQLAMANNEDILYIAEDKSGFIWTMNSAGNERGFHLDMFDPKTRTCMSFDSVEKGDRNLSAKIFNFLTSDTRGNIWLGTNNGLFIYDFPAKRFRGYFTGEDIRYIYEAPSHPGILWLSTWNTTGATGLRRFNTKDGSQVNYKHSTAQLKSLLNDSVFYVFEDHEKRLWVGTAQGLSLFDPQTETFTSYIPGDKNPEPQANNCYDIKEDQNGALWILSGKGLLYLSSIKTELQRFAADNNEPNGLPDNTLYNSLIDRNGAVWLGTFGFGILRLNEQRSRFEFIHKTGKEKGYPGGKARGIGLLKDGTYLVSTSKGLFHSDSTFTIFNYIPLLKDKESELQTRAVTVDKEGIAWIGTSNYGLFRYDFKTKQVKRYLNDPRDSTSLSHNDVNLIYEDRLGRLWIGTWGGGLCLLNKKTDAFKRLPFIVNGGNTPPNGSLDDNEVVALFEDRKGILWVGTNKGGLNRLNENKNNFTSYYDPDNGLASVTAINEDRAGRFWVGSNLWGLFLFDRQTGSFKRFQEKDGLVYDNVESITEDTSGQLWIASARGYSIMNPQNFHVRQLTTANGLPHNELTGANVMLPNGMWLAGTSDGIIRFEPGKLVTNPVPPAVYLQSLTYTKQGNSKSTESVILLNDQKEIELAYNENRISFQYVGIHYSNPTLNKYKYQLVGYDKDWISASTQRNVTYTNLSPGTYYFHVKASNSDGVWSENDATLTVVINPPWWATWWFRLLSVIALVIVIYAIIKERSRKLKAENILLEQKVNERTQQLQQSIHDLKSTQAQLIQSEKMASLGELTAGIAHEIQNPLNFINNFSEVNTELIEEAGEEINKGNIDEVKTILSDIKDNEQKILHHGKRADSIVKGMLQHSRISTGQKEPTDINALADEYLRLSYHGMRAKDKTFNAEIKTDFDTTIEKINVVPQDIGRVLLNLLNNAFYACTERSRSAVMQNVSTSLSAEQAGTAGQPYEPIVSVGTKKVDGRVEIHVLDNGIGIAQKIVDKIFQPFFTTKPTGQGTGLGLSLSYDIIKAHGGEIRVETKEGEGSEFIIQLPNH